jgi:hypothetical protein
MSGEGKGMTEAEARRIASEWYAGEGSALYEFASTGTRIFGLEREIRKDILNNAYEDTQDLRKLYVYLGDSETDLVKSPKGFI